MRVTSFRWMAPRTATCLAAMLLAAAGCTTARHPGPVVSAASTASPATARDSGTLQPAAALRPVSRQQLAVADATRILAAFAVPPGARPLPAALRSGHGALGSPLQAPGTGNVVDKASWWLVSGQPRILGWEAQQLSKRFEETGGIITDGPPGAHSAEASIFSLPPVPAVLDSRQLIVTVVDVGHGQTGIRVDAQVTWLAAQPSGERVPRAAAVLTITPLSNVTTDGGGPVVPVTITSAAVIGKISGLLAVLPVQHRGSPRGCYSIAQVTLTFRATPAGPPLATVLAPGQCDGIAVTVQGKTRLPLDGVHTFLTQLRALAGLRWTISLGADSLKKAVK